MTLTDRVPPTPEEYVGYKTAFCNWGRWGEDDSFGTLNFITPETRRQAAMLVREGTTISCSRPIDTQAGPANPYPAHHFVTTRGSGGIVDYIGLFIHGVVNTHIDALCHLPVGEEPMTWNRQPLDHYRMPERHTGTIDFWKDGIITRGVLYDIPRLRGTDYIEPGRPIHGWELEDAAAAQGIEPRPGDAVLVRGGYSVLYEKTGIIREAQRVAGVHVSCIEFLYEYQAALMGWDMMDAPEHDQWASLEGIAEDVKRQMQGRGGHVHRIVIPYLGLPLVDNTDFEALAWACAERNRWEFMFVVAPLLLVGGTGSPANPLAVF